MAGGETKREPEVYRVSEGWKQVEIGWKTLRKWKDNGKRRSEESADFDSNHTQTSLQ